MRVFDPRRVHRPQAFDLPLEKDWCGTQRITEFDAFIDRLLEHGVESVFWIGVADGGNQWRLAVRYAEAGRRCRVFGVDVRFTWNLARTMDQLQRDYANAMDFEFYLANTRFLAADDLPGPFDAAFVDGTHAYEMARRDYELADAVTTRLIGMHDIQNVGYPNNEIGSHDFWEEIKQGRRFEEFIDGKRFGIGLLHKEFPA
jgi:hypothetical protein